MLLEMIFASDRAMCLRSLLGSRACENELLPGSSSLERMAGWCGLWASGIG